MAKKGNKSVNIGGNLVLIHAKVTNRVCVHGSLACRICTGITTTYHEKRKKQ